MPGGAGVVLGFSVDLGDLRPMVWILEYGTIWRLIEKGSLVISIKLNNVPFKEQPRGSLWPRSLAVCQRRGMFD